MQVIGVVKVRPAEVHPELIDLRLMDLTEMDSIGGLLKKAELIEAQWIGRIGSELHR